MRTHFLVFLALVMASSPMAAQSNRPEGWRIRTDVPAHDSAVAHQRMPPGWHITTGPSAILYDPGHQAHGRFAIETEVFLFPGTNNEGYGVFLGGADLESPAPSWVAFLVTRDGSATVQRLTNGTVTAIFPVTRSSAVKPHPGQGTSHNVMHVLVEGDSVVFSANGERIVALPSSDLRLDGTFGFRVGTDANLHVSNFDLVTRLAPFRVSR